jgi:hypothetical protein
LDHPLRRNRLGITPQARTPKCCLPDLPGRRSTRLPHVNQRVGWATILRHPIARPQPRSVGPVIALPKEHDHASLSSLDPAWARCLRYRNINRSSIDYASRPRLRSRLTLGGLTFPRNPWAIGGRVSLPSFATHAGIRTRQASTARLPGRFTRLTTLPYPTARLSMPGLPDTLGSRSRVVPLPQLRWCA